MDKANIVVDASVIAKWMLSDEGDVAFALRIREDFIQKRISISLPTFVVYETNNLLRSAVIRRRIDVGRAKRAYEGFLELSFVFYSSEELLLDTLKKALVLDISSYDASCVVLSEHLQIPFYTADKKLVEKARSKLVQNVESYVSIVS